MIYNKKGQSLEITVLSIFIIIIAFLLFFLVSGRLTLPIAMAIAEVDIDTQFGDFKIKGEVNTDNYKNEEMFIKAINFLFRSIGISFILFVIYLFYKEYNRNNKNSYGSITRETRKKKEE